MLTVLLATKNRASMLPGVLKAFAALTQPRGGWKIIIVDNGSLDNTRDIVCSFKESMPLVYLYEPKSGKNRALNTGLSEIEGDLVVLTDDDVFPHDNWLVEFRAAADANEAFSIFGGRVLPRWEVCPDNWILHWVPLAPCFALTDPFLKEGPVQSHSIFGPNMAVRRQAFDAGHTFDVSIGPNGKNYPMGSETEFVRRLVRLGLKTFHCERAIVEHFISTSQMQKSWVLSRAIRFGRGQQRLARATTNFNEFPSWLGVPRYMYRDVMTQAIAYAMAFASRDEEKMFRVRWALNYIYGQMIEARSINVTKQACH